MPGNKAAKRLNPLRLLRNNRGIAILISLFALTMMIFIASEVGYDTTVEYVIASQQVNRLKAYYAAKAGVEISLLRIQLYKQAMISLGDSLGPQKSMLDLIWQFPLTWPPLIPTDSKVSMVDKDMIDSSVKDSLMEAQYATTISPMTGKLNLNDIGSDVKTVQQTARNELLQMFDTQMRNDDDFKKKYGATNFEEVVNNIQDWVTTGAESANGGDKNSRYQKMDLKDTNRDFIPPGRPFKTMDELHMVAGMTDDFYKLIGQRFTIYGVQGVNVNYAQKEMLMALDPTFTEEAANAVIKRRSDPKEGGPFPPGQECASQFLNYVAGYGVNTQAISNSKINLVCDSEYNFKVESTGISQKSRREITAITFDLDNLSGQVASELTQQDQQNNPGQSASPNPISTPSGTPAAPGAQQPAKMKPPKGRPTVVYWDET